MAINSHDQPPPAGDPPADLLDELLAAGRVLVALTARSLARLDSELTLPQFRMLVVVAGRGAQRTTDLAAELGVTPSTVTRNCDRLVRRGLARRFRRADDRRVAWIALTGPGKELIGEVMRRRRADVERLVHAAGLPAGGAVAAALAAFVAAAGEVPENEWWWRWERCAEPDGPPGP